VSIAGVRQNQTKRKKGRKPSRSADLTLLLQHISVPEGRFKTTRADLSVQKTGFEPMRGRIQFSGDIR
jgi:hypothetical protein